MGGDLGPDSRVTSKYRAGYRASAVKIGQI